MQVNPVSLGKMSSGNSTPVDVFWDRVARDFFQRLLPVEQEVVQAAVDRLMNHPHADEVAKIRLPFPFLYGTIGYRVGGFFITYGFDNAVTIRIYTVSRDTGQYWG